MKFSRERSKKQCNGSENLIAYSHIWHDNFCAADSASVHWNPLAFHRIMHPRLLRRCFNSDRAPFPSPSIKVAVIQAFAPSWTSPHCRSAIPLKASLRAVQSMAHMPSTKRRVWKHLAGIWRMERSRHALLCRVPLNTLKMLWWSHALTLFPKFKY